MSWHTSLVRGRAGECQRPTAGPDLTIFFSPGSRLHVDDAAALRRSQYIELERTVVRLRHDEITLPIVPDASQRRHYRSIDRIITFVGNLNADQRKRLI